jgi:hypothetical protein
VGASLSQARFLSNGWGPPHPFGRRFEQGVAGSVTKSIVCFLEMVEVHGDDRNGIAIVNDLLQAFHHAVTVQ